MGKEQMMLPDCTLTQLLEQHWRRLLHETSATEFAFTASVRAHYEASVAPTARSIEWSSHADPVSRMRRDAEKINRWFREDIYARFPAEAVEAFIAAFPDDRRLALQVALAQRQGMLVFPLPLAAPGQDGRNLGEIARDAGAVITDISLMLDDGVIDERDADKALRAIADINETMAVLAEMRERILRQVFRQQ